MTTSTRTFSPRARHIERRWYVVDAEGAVLGRLASEVAKILRGKHKPIFAPHVDTGDHVIVVNARGVRLSGGKENEKVYYRHSGYPGGLREIGYARLLAERPVLAVEKAVRGMLPKNRLAHGMLNKLKVYEGAEHPHEAQRPVALKLGEVPRWEGLPQPKAPPQRTPRQPKTEEAKPSRTRSTSASGPGGRTATKGGTGRRTSAKSAASTRGETKKASRPKARSSSSSKPKDPAGGATGTTQKSGGRRRTRAKKES
jgi:large subunit ribosomal protein L13